MAVLFDLCDLHVSFQAHASHVDISRHENRAQIQAVTFLYPLVVCLSFFFELVKHKVTTGKVKQITTTPTEKHNEVISLSCILNSFTKALKTSSLNYNYAQLALQQWTTETTIPGTPASEHSAKANAWSCDSTHFLRCCLYSQSIKNAILAAFHVCTEIH